MIVGVSGTRSGIGGGRATHCRRPQVPDVRTISSRRPQDINITPCGFMNFCIQFKVCNSIYFRCSCDIWFIGYRLVALVHTFGMELYASPDAIYIGIFSDADVFISPDARF